MTHSLLAAFVVLAFMSTCKDDPVPAEPLPNDPQGRITTIAKNYRLPTLAVSIHTPDTALQFTYRMDHPDVHSITHYGVGSTTKLLAALVVMHYVEQGKVSLDDPLSQYYTHRRLDSIAWFRAMTIRHLLSHTSGLPDYSQNPAWHKAVGENCAPTTVEDKVTMTPAPASTDTLGRFHYSNINYVLLEKVLEQVTDKSAATVFNEWFISQGLPGISLNPADMDGQSFYAQDLNSIQESTYWQEHYGFEGGAFATANDLAAILRKTFVDKTVLRPETLASMTTFTSMEPYPVRYGDVTIDQYGLGVMKFEWKGHTFIGHPGGTLKYQCFAFIDPATNSQIILLSNGSGRNFNKAFLFEILCEAMALL